MASIRKGPAQSAVISEKFIPKSALNLNSLNFSLKLNDHIVQEGNSSDMLYSIDELIEYISKYITLRTGDLIYTGTPEGVGPVSIGDAIVGKIEDEEMFRLAVK